MISFFHKATVGLITVLSLISGGFYLNKAQPQVQPSPVRGTVLPKTVQHAIDNASTSTLIQQSPRPVTKKINKNTKKTPETKIKRDLEQSSPGNLASTPPPLSNASTTPLPNINFDQINTKAESALVNIICVTKTSGILNPISGSGVIIDSRGIVLTNAHIGQYFLLKNIIEPDFVNCAIRTGNPATPKYTAKLLYISPQWINNNSNNIKLSEPKGTGENDFAILLIDGTISGSNVLPTNFPFLPMHQLDSDISNQNILVAAYPAGFLGGIIVQQGLYNTSSVTKVKQVFSYTGTTYDFLDIFGSAVAQKGSSGGAVVDQNGNLIGIIATVTDGPTTSERELGAITIGHINRSLAEYGLSLDKVLNQDIYAESEQFNRVVAPKLETLLENSILKQ